MTVRAPGLEGIQVSGDRAIVDIIEDKSQTASGIFLHPYRVENYFKAVVLQSNIRLINAGDIVIVAKNMGKDARIGDTKYLLFNGTEGFLAKIGKVNEQGEHELYVDTKL